MTRQIKNLRVLCGGLERIRQQTVHGLLRSVHRRGHRPDAPVHAPGGGGGRRRRPGRFPGLVGRCPANQRVQVLFRMKALLDKHLEELTHLLATENGKVWDEAMGDVLKVTEVVEFACGIPHLMKGPRPNELHQGLRHHPVPGAPGRVRRDRPLELPGHDPHGLDGPAMHRHRQHPGAEGRQLRAPERHAHPGTVGGGRAAQGRHQPGHLQPERGRDPAEAPGREGRLLRRLHLGRAGTSTPRPPPPANGCRP